MTKLAIKGGPKTVDEEQITRNLQYKAKYPIIDEPEINAVVELMKSGKLSIAGRQGIVEQMEDDLQRYYSIPYVLSCNCGTAALHSAYLAAGIGPGTEVITTPYTWITSVTAILSAGGIPVFADIDPYSHNIEADTIAKQITPQTRAISITHLYGYPADMDPIMQLAKENNLMVIEDCSQAHGAQCKGRKVGTIGHIGCFSLQAGKQMIAGEGGFLITADKELYERAMLFGQHPARLAQCITIDKYRPYVSCGLGYKYRIPPLSAALAKVQLAQLDQWNAQRIKNADRLTKKLAGIKGIRTPRVPSDRIHTYYMYAMRYVKEELSNLDRDVFIEAVKAQGVPIMPNYTQPIHQRELFQLRQYPDRKSPWQYDEVKRDVVYGMADCPQSLDWTQQELLIYFPRFTEYCPELMDAFAEGIKIVVDNVSELL